ncbi:type III-B CRISPR module RAMP protein Cmr4 [Geminocystis sp. CENA526]|uniref:type III-B CRISPR module RAMP protein Cmr4 n=1 Tax=Geminocystis sp. CENA526 TaxID=1355871 RepID=UPI003D6EE9AE
MSDFRVGYLYSLSPVHCGGEGDLGNILEIAREVHTNFPYIPGSTLRGNIRDELEQFDRTIADKLFGKKLDGEGQMGVHQVWFGDARLLWIPMATMARNNQDVFTWVSSHSLIRDHALVAGLPTVALPNCAVGTLGGTYHVADAQINVTPISTLSDDQKSSIELSGNWCDSLREAVKPAWETNHLVLPDADFQILMEHSLWTQVRNKIQDSGDQAGSAEVFWTDVCIPRDTIFYYPWGYSIKQNNPIGNDEHNQLMEIIQGLIQVGGQANVGRGWVQSWTPNHTSPVVSLQPTSV